MSPRCEAVLPVAENHPKPQRCPESGAARVDGVVVCRGHRAEVKTPAFTRYLRWTVPTRTEPERFSKLTRFPSQGPASAELFVMAVT